MFVTPYEVRFADVDNAGIFYYPRFFNAFHVAFEEWWQKGVKRPYHLLIGEDRIGFPAVHIETDFRKPVTFGDPMEIRISLLRLGRTSAVFRFRVAHRQTGEVHVQADITKVIVDMDRFKPIEPPEHVKAALESIRANAPD